MGGARDVATLAEDFIQRADMDSDGKISKQEFMDILELQIEVARVEHENKAIFYKFMRPMDMRRTTTDKAAHGTYIQPADLVWAMNDSTYNAADEAHKMDLPKYHHDYPGIQRL